MGTFRKQEGSNGFAVVEAILILVIVAGVLGAGAYVYSKHHKANTTANAANAATTTTASSQAEPLNGTTNSVQQLMQQEVQSETSADSSVDAQNMQTVTNVNSAATNVGGAYNENTL